MFELVIDVSEIHSLEAITVWRIGYDNSFTSLAIEIVTYFEPDIFSDSCAQSVAEGNTYHLGISITSDDSVFATWIGFSLGFSFYFCEYVLVM